MMDNSVRIRIDSQVHKHDLNPYMYGVFFEEINHSGDGGLYPELVRNRSFCDAKLPEGTVYYDGHMRNATSYDLASVAGEEFGGREYDPEAALLEGWKLRTTGNVLARIEPWFLNPRNPKVANQLKCTVSNTSQGECSIINEGFWGMHFKPGKYFLTIIARGEGIQSLQAEVITPSGATLASILVDGIEQTFTKHVLEVNIETQARGCKLHLKPTADGVLYLDFVSLFPQDTYKGRANGMRKDLAETIAALHPKFFRFPGGCLVEGVSFENAFHFRDTLGPVEDRPGKWTLWWYRRSDGIGFHEYLQFCEDIGAEAMYVFNCGITCQLRKAQYANWQQMEEVLQEAIDALDYAMAPSDTPMGALRAANGHPEPFKVRYVEIGNENHGRKYVERYNYCYRALKQRYPQIEFIMTTDYDTRMEFSPDWLDNEPVRPEAIELVDVHYYEAPQTMVGLKQVIDNFERGGPKLYVGEFGTTSGAGIGNMASACAEAALMITMENNGDLVRLASFAPLMCNINDRKWPVNLICFDDQAVFGIPSYHVQKLFFNNMEKTVVHAEAEVRSFNDEAKVSVVSGIAEDGSIIVKLSNFSYNVSKTSFDLDFAWKEARVWEITADSPTDTNDESMPERVCAKQVDFSKEDFVMRPYSVYLLRFTV